MIERLRNKAEQIRNLAWMVHSTGLDPWSQLALTRLYRGREGRKGPIQINAKGFGPIAVRPNTDDHWIAYELQQLYGLPPELIKRLAERRKEQGRKLTGLDLGANIGLATLKFHEQLERLGIDHQLVSVEPDADNFGMFLTNLALSKDRYMGKPIIPIRAGIGPKNTKMQLTHANGYRGTCTFKLEEADDTGSEVDVVTFETLINKHLQGTPPDILKCDIEGFEQFLPWMDILKHDEYGNGVSMLYIERHDRTNGSPDSFQGVIEATTALGYVQIPGYGISNEEDESDDLLFIHESLLIEK